MKNAPGHLRRRCRYTLLSSLFFAGLLTISNSTFAQDQPGPAVEWRAVTWAPTTPGDGYIVDDHQLPYGNTNPVLYNWPLGPVGPVVAQSQDDSDEDWWQAHTNIYNGNGTHIGYVAVGFVRWVNWYGLEASGCYHNHHGPFVENEFDRHDADVDYRRGGARAAIARFDLDGNMIYCKPHLNGIFFDVIQDPEGNLVAIGHTFNTVPYSDMGQNTIYYNPKSGMPLEDFSDSNCTSFDDASGKRT